MSFGTSVGDIILLIQLAHKNYRNCKEAGGEYVEIAREVRSLHSVLKTVRDEAERKDSLIFKSGSEKTKELVGIADGCKGVLEGVDVLLTKYKGLAPESTEVGRTSRLWQRFRFGTEIEDLGKLRWKIITCTSTLAVLVDSINLKATERVGDIAGRIEGQLGSGFAEMRDRLEGFEDMRKAVLFIATRARASQRYQSMESVLSLSTYADDDKEVWRQFRSQLVSLGFKSDSLDRHMEILKAYMMKLDQTGVLDESVQQSNPSTLSWCGNASFRATNLSLLGTVDDEQSDQEDQMEENHEARSQEQSSIDQLSQINRSPARIQQTELDQPQILTETEDLQTITNVLSSTEELSRQKATTRRRRIPRIKVDEPTSTEGPESRLRAANSPFTKALPLEAEVPSPNIPSAKTNSDNRASTSRQPHHHAAYAQSYYSISEAGTSRLMLSINTSGLDKSIGASKRPQQPNRPTSWAGPDSQVGTSRRPEPRKLVEYDSDSDSTILSQRLSPRKKRDPRGSKEKVSEWLEPEIRYRSGRSRASSSPKPGKPMSISNEELTTGRGWVNAERDRPSLSTSKSQTKVGYEKARKQPYFDVETARSYHPKTRYSTKAEDAREKRYQGYTDRERRPSSFTAYANTKETKKGARDNLSFDYKHGRDFQSPEARINGKDVPASNVTLATKAAIVAGVTEAFRARNDPGSWTGEKARRIITAAIGAGGISASGQDEGPPPQQQQQQAPQAPPEETGISESVVSGLAISRLVNGVGAKEKSERNAGGSADIDSDSKFTPDLDSDSDSNQIQVIESYESDRAYRARSAAAASMRRKSSRKYRHGGR